MFSLIRAALLAAGTLVLAGTVHTVSTAAASTEVAIALVPAPVAGVPSAQVTSATGAGVRAIAIGY